MRSRRSRTPSLGVPISCTACLRAADGNAIRVPRNPMILQEYQRACRRSCSSRLATLHDRTPRRAAAAPLHDPRRRTAPGARASAGGEPRGRRVAANAPRPWRPAGMTARPAVAAPLGRPVRASHDTVEPRPAVPPPPRARITTRRTHHRARSESLIDAGFLDTRMSGAVRFAPPFQPPREVLMTKAQLVTRLAEGTGASRKQIDQMLASMIDTVVKTVKKGESVKIPGLGIFRLRKMKARMVRNPQTGEPIKIPARKKVGFSVAKTFKETVLGNSKK